MTFSADVQFLAMCFCLIHPSTFIQLLFSCLSTFIKHLHTCPLTDAFFKHSTLEELEIKPLIFDWSMSQNTS